MLSQAGRLVTLETPLGDDVFLIGQLKGNEGISQLFSFELDLLSEDPQIDFSSILDQSVTIQLYLFDGDIRFFNGIVATFRQQMYYGADTNLFSYHMTLVPWVWLLSKTVDNRFFLEKNIPDIIEEVFAGHGFSNFEFALSATYDPREFCVQYQETDFAFISRLMEQEGIFYYFKHEDGEHTMVLCDDVGRLEDCLHQETAEYHPDSERWSEADYISSMGWRQDLQSRQHMCTDYNFTMPNSDFLVSTDTTSEIGSGNRNIYEYPGTFDTRQRGEIFSAIRMEELETQITKIQGVSKCRAFASGTKFGLLNYFREDRNNVAYLLTSVQHSIKQEENGSPTTVPLVYSNTFTCLPASVPFRPSRITSKPHISGVQTAIVVGPDDGEEINTDEHGRVQVRFHWARRDRENQEISCWIRVGQIVAGAGWGAVFIPRIGHEVLVEFIDGDPDRPIITGQVYHGANTPPYPLPAEKTKSTIKTNSSIGGEGFNEIRFEDKKDEEELFFHAQCNQTISVESNRSESVGSDRSLSVGNDKTENVKNNRTETVEGSHTEAITQDRTLTIDGNEDIKIGGEQVVSVTGDVTEKFATNHTEQTSFNYNLSVGKSQKTEVSVDGELTIGSNMSTTIGANSVHSIGGNMTIDANGAIALKATKITLNASASLDIICGGTSIKLTPGTLDTSSPAITTTASATHTIQGAIVKQNC